MKNTCYSKLREMLHRQIHAKLKKKHQQQSNEDETTCRTEKTFNRVSLMYCMS